MTEQEITQAADLYIGHPQEIDEDVDVYATREAYKAGMRKAFAIMESNRLAACDSQTPEEAEREEKFVIDFIKKNSRTPTFSDCIEITRKEMISKACKWLASVNLDYYQIREGVFSKELVKDFRKAMEGYDLEMSL